MENSNDVVVAPIHRLTNRGEHTLNVPIVNTETGATDTVFVQPGGKPRIPEGWVVDKVFAHRNPDLTVHKL